MSRARAHTRYIDLLLIGAQGVMRALLRDFLQSNLPELAIGEAGDGCRALTLARACRPRVMILIDIHFGDYYGIELVAQFKSLLPDTRPIVITQQQGTTYFERLRAAGAFAYVDKQKIFTELLPIVTAALSTAPSQDRGGTDN